MPEPPKTAQTSSHARVRVSEICAGARVTEIFPLPVKEGKFVKRLTKTSRPHILTSSPYKAILVLAKEKSDQENQPERKSCN